jgi:hypothetical protein
MSHWVFSGSQRLTVATPLLKQGLSFSNIRCSPSEARNNQCIHLTHLLETLRTGEEKDDFIGNVKFLSQA